MREISTCNHIPGPAKWSDGQRVQLQLNRGELRHALARWLFFANRGEFRTGDYEEIMNKASCLSLLSNAVLVWNTPSRKSSPSCGPPGRPSRMRTWCRSHR